MKKDIFPTIARRLNVVRDEVNTINCLRMELSAFIDTGNQCNMIRQFVVDNISYNLEPYSMSIEALLHEDVLIGQNVFEEKS